MDRKGGRGDEGRRREPLFSLKISVVWQEFTKYLLLYERENFGCHYQLSLNLRTENCVWTNISFLSIIVVSDSAERGDATHTAWHRSQSQVCGSYSWGGKWWRVPRRYIVLNSRQDEVGNLLLRFLTSAQALRFFCVLWVGWVRGGWGGG